MSKHRTPRRRRPLAREGQTGTVGWIHRGVIRRHHVVVKTATSSAVWVEIDFDSHIYTIAFRPDACGSLTYRDRLGCDYSLVLETSR